MRKPTLRRVSLSVVQHILAVIICYAVASIMFHSYIHVQTMDGNQTYSLSPITSEPVFEDSVLFRDIFQGSVKDIIRLVVIKGQIETNGTFDPQKKIDVTKFADRKGTGNDCPITATYELEELIKWGKNGLQYTNRVMSMSEFVNFFGPATISDNFALDANGNLYFAGFLGNAKESLSIYDLPMEKGRENLSEVEEVMLSYTTKQLEDMAFSYIMAKNLDEVTASREDDGSMTIYVRMLNCKYETINGDKQLTNYASNWIDYIKLQRNVTEAIQHLSENYARYQNCYELYEENAGNLKYVVRMLTKEGMKTYTNLPDFKNMKEEDITDSFLEYRRYLIYYPDSLEFMGNTSLTESDIYGFLQEYDYAYPETSHIWIGVDTSYPVSGDAFYEANTLFQKLVPNIGLIISLVAFMVMLWAVICIYLSVTTGMIVNEKNEVSLYLNGIDRIWTEFFVAFAVCDIYIIYRGANILRQVIATFNQRESYYNYLYFAAYGFIVSVFSSIIWYSFVRRIRNNTLWRDSFIKWLFTSLARFGNFILTHRNNAISSFLPYNFFLLSNIFAILYLDRFNENTTVGVLIVIALVLADGFVGILLFRKRAEQNDIVDGIRKIRDGEVDYKIEAENLHGENREMADAVNTIGEGIKNAVRTSMKDEQMKTDLITNVSHDIKTPLTSIISYVDLLKRLHINENPAKEYIEILDSKAQRLKQLTDDLVEASKISSGNIVLNMEKLNFSELLNQTIGEFSEKLEEHNLTPIFENSKVAAYVLADSRRMWRVVENLFNNICKYALEGTRVYIDVTKRDGFIETSIKNISKRQMNIHPDELTERFIRGDSSRSTEGSGLGLSIAKSLTQVQGGTFRIELDGDLFKVIISFKEYEESEETVEESQVEEQSEEVIENNE